MYPDNGVLNHKDRGSNGMDIDAIFSVNIGNYTTTGLVVRPGQAMSMLRLTQIDDIKRSKGEQVSAKNKLYTNHPQYSSPLHYMLSTLSSNVMTMWKSVVSRSVHIYQPPIYTLRAPNVLIVSKLAILMILILDQWSFKFEKSMEQIVQLLLAQNVFDTFECFKEFWKANFYIQKVVGEKYYFSKRRLLNG